MGLRPVSARWFEVLTPKDELAAALSGLARTGAVELQTHSQSESVATVPGLEAALGEYAKLEQRYGVHWPEPRAATESKARGPREALGHALDRLRAWSREAEAIVVEIEQLETRGVQLELLASILSDCGESLPDLDRLAAAGPFLASSFHRMPPGVAPETLAPSVIIEWLDCGGVPHLLATGPAGPIERLHEQLHPSGAVRIEFPSWLGGDPQTGAIRVGRHLEESRRRREELKSELHVLDLRHDVAAARADLSLLDWVGRSAPELPVTEHFAWISGWTSDPDGRVLEPALATAGVQHVLRFGDAPPGARPPIVLRNRAWIRPFEVFARLMGVPATDEADPSVVVAIVAPLMFGYMFGDVGQGLVLVVVGLLLRRRLPVLGLLVPGGILAAVFGLLFGSVFALEGVVPALWLHPLADPLTVLGVTLAGGVAVLGGGLALDLVQSVWRGEARRWLQVRGGLVVAWLGVLAGLVDASFLGLVVVGAIWFMLGHGVDGPRTVSGFAQALGELVEGLLQLLVNTVSFVRVGAFALAHAGLSSAVAGMAAAAGSAWGAVPVLVFGNLAIIALEGLVVSIQTTRLVLFEFFTRFLVASGRPFRPLLRPNGGHV